MARLRNFPWPILILLALGVACTYGGFATYADQHSGTPGTAKVTRCTGGGGKYQPGVRCSGTWTVGGDPIFGSGSFAVGRVEGAGYRDVGEEIEVRIHGTDHATVPALGTSIMLWAIGGVLTLLSLWWPVASLVGAVMTAARGSGRSPA